MSIFFLLIGLELEREIYEGEISDIRNASLPIVAAIGGMVVPAGLFMLFNFGTATQSGVGIPIATDIAFAIGILALLGSRIPGSLKILLTAIAVIDDLGAILVIAAFYTASLALSHLLVALAIFGLLLMMNRLKVRTLTPYLLGGMIMWYFIWQSGIHPTITGVLLAFVIPFRDEGERSPSYRLQHWLHKPVAFLVLPLFALANTCITIDGSWYTTLNNDNSIGILTGLIVGKPLGILLFSMLAVTAGFCQLPQDVRWKDVLGLGMLCGIGFTMSIFVTLLAYDQPDVITQSKIAILIASIVSGTLGFLWLRAVTSTPRIAANNTIAT
jgi:NhaA family Na+:H+ antiporter